MSEEISYALFDSGVVLVGDCLARLGDLDDASIDSIVTDPPYLISFMGKDWDSADGVAGKPDVWRECLRVLKPGGHLLAFGATRTYHRMTVAIEDAGFEIRDSIHWTYGSGFPKSLDVSKAIDKMAGAEGEVVGKRRFGKTSTGQASGWNANAVAATGEQEVRAPATTEAQQWQGWGTALKPSHEPIVVARKPLTGTVAANVLEHGTGALNIEGCRVGATDPFGGGAKGTSGFAEGYANDGWKPGPASGRWPANTVLTHSADCQETGDVVQEKVETTNGAGFAGSFEGGVNDNGGASRITSTPVFACAPDCPVAGLDRQSDGASRFFTQTTWEPEWDDPFLYVPKPGKKERNAGLEGKPTKGKVFNGHSANSASKKGGSVEDKFSTAPQANYHPTVKPLALMRHLVRLTTPPGGLVLDPFLGSGTTAVAAVLEGFTWVGCEMTPDYLPLIEGRVLHAENCTKSAD